MLQLIFSSEFFFAILRITAPILLVTLAADICEKAGVSNIGLEGTMMISALFGSLFAYYAKNWFVGLLVAVVTGIIVSLVMGFFAFNLKTNIILTGTAINMVGSGGTIFLVKVITGITEGSQMTSTSGLITGNLQIPVWNIPLIKDIPVIGSILSGHCILTYVAFILAGVLAGLSGAYMSMYYAMGWSQNMVAGRGFIALAAQAMGSGEPVGSMLAALIFGFAQALSVKVSSLGVNSFLVSPIPYAVTIIGLVVFALLHNSKAKKAHSSQTIEKKKANN